MASTLDSPVRYIPTDADEPPAPGVALCLSGGGYRAMLFHAGALWRLNDAKLLPKVTAVSSVSGGSIAAGLLGARWSRLAFDALGKSPVFPQEIVAPLREFANSTIDILDGIEGVLLPGAAGNHLASSYKALYGSATLQDLPDSPVFTFNSTSAQSGVLWRFKKAYMGDYRVGFVDAPRVPLATAVAASSAFPAGLSPLVLPLDPSKVKAGERSDLHREPFTRHAVLTDGGVYDNLGIETVWKKYDTIFVSDACPSPAPEGEPSHVLWTHAMRAISIIHDQVGTLRKRQVIGSFVKRHRKGTYWGIGSDIANYGLADPLPCPVDQTTQLAGVPTRLARLDPVVQERLINWGYAVTDAALRKWIDPSLERPKDFPYPEASVG